MSEHDIAVSVRGLSKSYTIAHNAPKHTTLGEALVHTLKGLRGSVAESEKETFWALKDVEFDIKKGDVVGIIGRNGAGKSTLLKILSRITEPTTGQIDIYGRVGSLLEVGTGFHPELTGRENIFMNGAILGMSKAEIARNFDAIVDFSGTEQFLDTPVKRYSSGMYVRLAFAVAAYLNPEILIVDEVLAVGDAEFQKKCLGKMQDVANSGRTVLFVSHNMAAVNRLCHTIVWMQRGQVQQIGNTNEVVSAYLSGTSVADGQKIWPNPEDMPGNDKLHLASVHVLGPDGECQSSLDIRRPFFIEMRYMVLSQLDSVRMVFRISTGDGTVVFTSSDTNNSIWLEKPRTPGFYTSRCEVPGNLLNEGHYSLSFSADIPFVEILFDLENVLSLQVEQTGGVSGRYSEKWPGVICPDLSWTIDAVDTMASGDFVSEKLMH